MAGFAGWVTVLCTTFGALEFLIGFIFPTGRAQCRALGRVIRLYWPLMIVFGAAIVLIQPGPLHLFPTLQNPFGIGPDLRGGRPYRPVASSRRFAPSLFRFAFSWSPATGWPITPSGSS